jgi:peptidoglycan/LPS O-acetylase OafA/YrhL
MVGDNSRRAVGRLDSLTAVRFFAAIYVVLFHYCGHVIPFWDQIGWGYIGVDLFFVLSGFILMYNYGDRANTSRAFYRLFLSARIARVYPAFLLAFVLATPAVISFALTRHAPAEAFRKVAVAAVATLSLLHAWFPRVAFFWNFPSWSVSDEMFFYCCFPLVAVLLKGFSERRSLFLALACGLLAPGFLAHEMLRPSSPLASLPPAVQLIPIVRLSQFVMGMAIGRIFLLRQHRPPLGRIWGILATVLVLCFAGFFPSIPFLPRVFATTPVFAILIYALARCERPSLTEKPFALGGLVLLGDASYSIYVLQMPVFYFCGFSVDAMTGRKLATYLVLLIGVSIASLKLVETPLRRRILSALAAPRPKTELGSLAAVSSHS